MYKNLTACDQTHHKPSRIMFGTTSIVERFPTPSWPCEFDPQHQTLPPLLRAHVWKYPAETATTETPACTRI